MRPVVLLLASLSLATAAIVFGQGPDKGTPARKQTPEPQTSSADLRNGKDVYDISCAVCHFHTSAAKKIGPGLRGLYKRGSYADGKPVNEGSLREWIEKGGKNMPGFKDSLTAGQVRDVIAYLKTL